MSNYKGPDTPYTKQKRYDEPGTDLGATNAVPRTTEFDLEKTPSRTRFGSWGDEQTFTVPKRGNKP